MTFGVSRVCPMLQGDLVLVFFIKFTTEFSEFGRANTPSRLWVAVLHKGFGFLRSCHGRIGLATRWYSNPPPASL